MRKFLRSTFCRPAADETMGSSGRARVHFIDLAKGVAIILVVAFHAGLTENIPAIGAMRMPLYFVLSGIFFKYRGFVDFFFKKINNLLIPFAVFLVLGLGILWRVTLLGQGLIEILGQPLREPFIANQAIWFLIALFWVNMLWAAIYRFLNKEIFRLIAVVACGFEGYVLSHAGIYLPLFISSAFTAIPFFYIGTLIRPWLIERTMRVTTVLVLAAIFLVGGIVYSIVRDTPMIEFCSNAYQGSVAGVFINSLMMVVGMLMLCKAIVWLPVISFLGRHSIVVLGLHLPAMTLSQKISHLLTGRYLSGQEVVVCGLLICWISIPLYRKVMPLLSIKRKKRDERTLGILD